jgi:hypothetical protein
MNAFKFLAVSFVAASLCADNCVNVFEAFEPNDCCCDTNPHRIRVGANYTYANIRPWNNPSTHGNLFGAQFSYEYWPENFVYAAFAFNWRQGNTKGGGGRRYIRDFDTQERIGYSFAEWGEYAKLAVYTGFGGRYMPEDVSFGGVSADFNYVQWYVPVGASLDCQFTDCFHWGFNFQWKPQILPTVQIQPLNGARWILTKKIDNFYFDMPFVFYWCEFSFTVTPFFELWHDGYSIAHTLTNLYLDLPSNRYYFGGVNVNLGWDF